MLEIKGAVTTAICYANIIEEEAVEQIRRMCDQEFTKDCQVRIMPDVHAGKGCTIGTTMTVKDKAVPNVVGVDIGCGMYTVNLGKQEIDLERFDAACHFVPSGMRAWEGRQERFPLTELRCYRSLERTKWIERSLGTLGGGNHFIELDRDEAGTLYAAVHSGSRSLGKTVTEFYLAEGQKALKKQNLSVPYEMTYLEGNLMEQYLHDVQIVQEYAKWNRIAILDELIKGMKWKTEEMISCVHNYIEDTGGKRMLRKGAISAKKGEPVMIPVNMRDGILLGVGKGTEDWNVSAPHGAGRILKRDEVKERYTVSRFRSEMKGIYSSCIGEDTLDEAPFAYRTLDEIKGQIGDTVEIKKRIRPVYNFKAGRSQTKRR